MYSTFRLARKYLYYYLTAANSRGHGIHSPFVFDFVTKVLNDERAYPAYSTVEGLRYGLLRNGTLLEIEDLGAGSVHAGKWTVGEKETRSFSRSQSVASIARHAAKPPLLGKLLFRVARHYEPSTILELGTSLGLSTAYLSCGAPDARVYTVEGAPAVAAIAEANLRKLGLDIRPITGHFDTVLPGLLAGMSAVELAFIDGNHRFEPTMRYFDMICSHAARSSVLIFDDIHWSAEMEAAWAAIKADARVYLTIDLFFLGFVFLREEFKVKQHFTIRF